MIVFSQLDLDSYKQRDLILDRIQDNSQPEDQNFTSQRWLLESLPKRMIYNHVYGDLLEAGNSTYTVIDIGGGYSALTRLILRKHRYFLLDIMAHDQISMIRQLENSLDNPFLIVADWFEFEPMETYDIIIANDLFPNVDQRLEIFIHQYLPFCREMRLTLTYYNTSRWYKLKRVDADEIFHVLAWDALQLKRVLLQFEKRIVAPNFDLLESDLPSLFENHRQVCSVVLQGDLSG